MRSFLEKVIVMVCVAVIVAGTVGVANAQKRHAETLVDFFKMTGEIEYDQPITCELEYYPRLICDENVSVTVTVSNYSYELGRQELVLERKEHFLGSPIFLSTFEVTLPSDDTLQLAITMHCDAQSKTSLHYYITTGSTLAQKSTDPRLAKTKTKPKTYKRVEGTKHSRDTLTVAQLQKIWTVVLDLRKPEDFDKAKEILGIIPDSCQAKEAPGHYVLKLSFDIALKLAENGVNINQPNWERDLWQQREADSVKQLESQDDGEGEPGKLDGSSMLSPPGVSLDYVEGALSPTLLPTGELITFHIRMNNNYAYTMESYQNGFRVYSPDGAEWRVAHGLALGFSQQSSIPS